MKKKLSRAEREEERVRQEAKRKGYEYRPDFKVGSDFSSRLARGFDMMNGADDEEVDDGEED